MSYKNFVDIKVSFDKEQFHANENINGDILVRNNSPIDLELENIQIQLALKHQGKGETDEIIIENNTIDEFKRITRGQTISFKFMFNPAYNVSFNGHNVTQSILIKTKVDIKKESEKLLRDEKLSDFKIGGYLKGLFSPDFYNETPVTLIKGNTNYLFEKSNGNIKAGIKRARNILLVGLIASVILSIFFYSNIEKIEVIYTFLALYALLFIGVYYYKIGPSQKVGLINYSLNSLNENSYEANLKLEKRSNIIKEINCQLIGKEKVTYNNGSSRSTATRVFFKGTKHKITPRNVLTYQSEFPEKSLPISINNNDFEIIWYYSIEVLTKNNIRIKGEDSILINYAP
ncbi:hypothetical protein F7018_13045 [Tenacibaculum aiptasiae]|uniref:Uncharacterized protein n=1 Tax=Tenacibaculum aiptasiae TaxID=426481 RepID=A0A7J5AD29_9FLAO|nr:hypothetical protein [Tenacibaculum aiptasiae]KAB1155393.1 hypothetical protein F7018_13045 [Tenacibaculum aiptasiae]